ncbi:hypothetical protein ACFLZV_06770 [Candidatus Margulisiibacteriota bacterium]
MLNKITTQAKKYSDQENIDFRLNQKKLLYLSSLNKLTSKIHNLIQLLKSISGIKIHIKKIKTYTNLLKDNNWLKKMTNT